MIGQLQAGPVLSSILLSLIYFYSMYLFSSLTGHIVALAGPFMDAARQLGTPARLITAQLAYYSTLCGCLTNYSSGPVVLYFSQGFSGRRHWFVAGALMGAAHALVYSTVGVLWWLALGWW